MNLVMKNLSVQVKNRNASVTFDRLPGLLADENQMVQLLQNLVSNAVKFGSRLPEVHISCKYEPGFHIFSVSDNGLGIEPQYFERIFKIFQRLIPKNEVEGTGIGLAICKIIVERHGGKIWVESEPGKVQYSILQFPIKHRSGVSS
jgi:light-regulated signal transduction histidine kinase (bacteriophytochrome)